MINQIIKSQLHEADYMNYLITIEHYSLNLTSVRSISPTMGV